MNKIIKKIETFISIHVAVEPGDLTRYDFLISKDGPDQFCISPIRSTFKFPQRISRFDIPDSWETIENWFMFRGHGSPTKFDKWIIKTAKEYKCNPCTVAAVVKTLKILIETKEL